MSEAGDFIRRSFKENDDKRDAGLTTPDDVKRFDDIVYGKSAQWQSLDVYRPKALEGRLPVIVSVHGGGWVYGDKERYQYYCMSLAQHGFAVINFTYRLAPEYKYPSGMEDTNSVFHWIFANAEKYGFDTGHIFAVGDSAGAHMLSVYCCICTNPEYASRYRFSPPDGFVPTAVALNCGVYKPEKETENGLMSELLANKGTDEEYDLITPINYVNEKFPPAFVMTCEGDFLIPQAELMYARLKELGVNAEYHFYGSKEQPLYHVFHCNMRQPEGALCNKEECDFFRSFC